MINDESHPEMQRAHKQLLQRLGEVTARNNGVLDKRLLHDMFECVKHHRQEWRRRGVDFPVMVALAFPGYGIVDWVRADLDIASIRQKVINFVRENPHVPMKNVVEAFRAAYPDLKPGEILEQHDTGIKAEERAEVRREAIKKEAFEQLGVEEEAEEPKDPLNKR
jgi:hypothetical protein